MNTPVIFLAFANDPDQHLPLLEQERKDISSLLIPLASQQHFQFFSEPSASTEDLSQYITEFKDRVAIFHYGGHSDSTRIFLANHEAHADGVAQLLGQQDNLKLVFLNGCSNRAQVDLLFQLNIPAVIATAVNIADRSAVVFAKNFYRALSTQHTISEAFKIAAANHLMESGQAVGIYRGVQLPGGEGEQLPWGLYVREGVDEIMDWKLPQESANSVIIRGAGMRYQPGETINEKLIVRIANAIAPFSVLIKAMMEEARRRDREPSMRDLRAAVIDAFPTPIGTHLRKLVISETISTERLQRIVNVYTVASELLAYTMLAQLWDAKVENERVQIPQEQHDVLVNFITQDPGAQQERNYVAIIRAVMDVFQVNNIEPFVEEFEELQAEFYRDSKFQAAYRFLEEMKKELRSTIAADEIESFCVQAEDQLATFIEYTGFAAKYTLATIKTIELLKERHSTPRYRHNLVVLNRLTASIGILDDTLVADEFTDNNAVVLLKDETTVHPYLNLTPFVIDENALAGQNNSKIFFFRYLNDRRYHYVFADNLRDPLQATRELDEFLTTMFNSFRRQVAGRE